MNDTMEHDDRIVVERLCAALDEVASTDDMRPVRRSGGRIGTGRRSPTWLAVAAVTALLAGGGVWVLTQRGPTDTGRGNGDGTVPATVASPTLDGLPATTSVGAGVGAVVAGADTDADQRTWYTLISPDLVPQRAIRTVCCSTYPFPGPATSVAWTIDTGGSADDPAAITAILAMTATPASSPAPPTTISADEPVVTRRQPDGSTWTFTSFGLTATERDRLIDLVVPGSGTPFVLPDPSASLLGFGFDGTGDQVRQEYLGSAGSVQLTVGGYQGELTWLTDATTTATPVTIAGQPALLITNASGSTVVWRTALGEVAIFRIPSPYGDRVAGLITAVEPAAPLSPADVRSFPPDDFTSVTSTSPPDARSSG